MPRILLKLCAKTHQAMAIACIISFVLVVSPKPLHAQAQPCSSFFETSGDTSYLADIGTATCELVWSNVSGPSPIPGKHQIIHPTGWLEVAGAGGYEEIDATVKALFDSMNMFEALGVLSREDLFYTTILVGAGYMGIDTQAKTGALIDSPTRMLHCPVLVGDWARHGAETAEDLQFIIAHELSHCYIHRYYINSIDVDQDSWWNEGLASYFAHLVYPSNDLEHTKTPRYSPNLRIFSPAQDPHSTVAFFHWLERQGQHDIIIDTFWNLAPDRGPIYFQRLLSEWEDIADNFHEFGQKFYTEGFNEITGSRVPLTQPVPNPREIDEIIDDASGTLEIVAHPFIIFAEKFELGGGRSYRINVEHNDVPGQYQVRIDDGDWQDMPSNIVTDCDKTTVITVLATSTASPEASADDFYTLDMEFQWEPSGHCGCGFALVSAAMIAEAPSNCEVGGPPLDRCLIGNWSLAPNSYRAELERLLPVGRILSAEATARIAISESGLADGCMHASSNVEFEAGGLSAGATTNMRATTTHQLYSTGNGELCSTEVHSDTVIRTVATLDGNIVNEQTMAGPPFSFSPRSEYICDINTLAVRTFPPGVEYVEHHFIRDD